MSKPKAKVDHERGLVEHEPTDTHTQSEYIEPA